MTFWLTLTRWERADQHPVLHCEEIEGPDLEFAFDAAAKHPFFAAQDFRTATIQVDVLE